MAHTLICNYVATKSYYYYFSLISLSVFHEDMYFPEFPYLTNNRNYTPLTQL